MATMRCKISNFDECICNILSYCIPKRFYGIKGGHSCFTAMQIQQLKQYLVCGEVANNLTFRMKATLVLNYLLFINCLQQFSLAAPMLQANENVVIASSDVKRDVEYRNSLFSIYSCRVQKAADAVRNKLQVNFK